MLTPSRRIAFRETSLRLLPAPGMTGVEPVRIPGNRTERKKVLLVDDEVEFLNAIEEMMERRARGIYEAIKAHRVEEVLDIFGREIFQAVMTDLHVLDRRGDVFAKQLKEMNSTVPVILITADVNDVNPDLTRYLSSIVPKPIDTGHLMNLLDLCVKQVG